MPQKLGHFYFEVGRILWIAGADEPPLAIVGMLEVKEFSQTGRTEGDLQVEI
ncbi:MAG: hypothetical protein MH132_08510 [Hydrotalea sp.]|nr:hypothetical protein [Hydrotalea sp.]